MESLISSINECLQKKNDIILKGHDHHNMYTKINQLFSGYAPLRLLKIQKFVCDIQTVMSFVCFWEIVKPAISIPLMKLISQYVVKTVMCVSKYI